MKKIGGASSKGWAESAPLVGIGLTDLTNIGGGQVAPPSPPGYGITEMWELHHFYEEHNGVKFFLKNIFLSFQLYVQKLHKVEISRS